MKPIRLSIEGLNSFFEKQTIDFTKYTDKGIFGIFGPTGSGKTTVIDAITLALYGEVARYDGSKTSFINSEAKNAGVSFEFTVKDGNIEQRYIVKRTFARNKEGNINSKKAELYKYNNNTEEPEVISAKVTEITKKIQEIIGLGYEDFTRSIILPQGKFSEFLMLKNKERRNMLERLFSIERYGTLFSQKINKEKSRLAEKITILTNENNLYEDSTEANLKKQEENYQKEIQIQEHLQSGCDALLKTKEELTNLNKNYKEYKDILDITILELSVLKEVLQKTEMEHIKAEAKYKEAVKLKYEKTPVLTDRKYNLTEAKKLKEKYLSLSKEITKSKNSLNEEITTLNCKNKELEQSENLVNKIQEQTRILLEEKNNYEFEISYKNDVEKAANIQLKLSEEINNLNKKKLKKELTENKINDNKNELRLLEKSLSQTKIEKETIEHALADLKKPMDIDAIMTLQQSLSEIELKIKEFAHNEELNQLQTKELNKIELTLKSVNEKYVLTLKEIETVEAELKSIDILENSNIIEKLARELDENRPCPVCGSLEHPNPAKHLETGLLKNKENLHKNYESLKSKKEILFDEIARNKIKANESSLKSKEVLAFLNNINIENLKETYKTRKSKFDLISAENEKYKLEKAELDKQKEEIDIELNKINLSLAKKQESLNKDTETLKEIEEEILKNETDKRALEQSLLEFKTRHKLEDFCKEYNKLKAFEIKQKELDGSINKTRECIEKTLKNIELFKIEIGKHEKDISIRETTISSQQNECKDLTATILKLTDGRKVDEYLKETLAEISDLEKNENESKETLENIKKIMQNNNEKYAALSGKKESFENLFAEQEKIIKERSYQSPENELKIKTNELEALRQELDLKKDKNTELKLKIQTIKDNLIKRAALLRELEPLEERFELVKQLSSLTEGNRFVEYLATKHLRYICAEASLRLLLMSNQRYSITLDDTDFVIVDHFNGGLKRPPQSLSGGEIFMTSLSLALALSSKIQMKNSAPLEVFFLDEGFGTLDDSLIDTVMDSLEQLREQSICVGVITHVEEIKNRIQSKIIVVPHKNGENGAKLIFE